MTITQFVVNCIIAPLLGASIYLIGYWMGAHNERRYWVKFIDEHLRAMKA